MNTLEKELRDLVGKHAPGDIVPNDEMLAETHDVSIRTIRRVMAKLRSEGLVLRARGMPTQVPGGDVGSDDQEPASSADRLAKELVRSIHRGDIRTGDALPQIKELAARYRMSDKTILGAYRQLEHDGVVSKIGKRFWVGGLTPYTIRGLRHTVWIVTVTREEMAQVFPEDELGAAYQRMDLVLRDHGILVKVCDLPTLREMIPEWTQRRSYPVGLVFWRIYDNRAARLIGEAVRPLVERGRTLKVKVLLDLGKTECREVIPHKVSSISRGNINTSRSRAVARHLLEHRYDSVTILQPGFKPGADYRRAYLRHLKIRLEILSQAGPDLSIDHVALGTITDTDRNAIVNEIMTSQEGYLQYLTKKYPAASKRSVSNVVERLRFVPSVDRLLSTNRSRTLWICTNERVAADALDVLEQGRVPVPTEVSIICLEHSPTYLHRGISYCAFDFNRAGYLMAHELIGDFPPERTRHGHIRIPTPVVHRGTSGE